MKAAGFSETSVHILQTTRHHISEDRNRKNKSSSLQTQVSSVYSEDKKLFCVSACIQKNRFLYDKKHFLKVLILKRMWTCYCYRSYSRYDDQLLISLFLSFTLVLPPPSSATTTTTSVYFSNFDEFSSWDYIDIVARMWRLYKTGIGLTTGFVGSHTVTQLGYSVLHFTTHNNWVSSVPLKTPAPTAATSSYGIPCHH
jgi:hypothetical protein